MYLSFGGKPNYRSAAYVEFGIDVGDEVAEAILKEYLHINEDIIDYYFSVGIQTRGIKNGVIAGHPLYDELGQSELDRHHAYRELLKYRIPDHDLH